MLSPIEPLSPSFERVSRILFSPFDFGKWFVLGFIGWVAYLGQGGFTFPNFGGGNYGGGGGSIDEGQMVLIVSIVAVLIFFGLAIWLVLLWLRSRFVFIFLESIAWNRTQIKAPWSAYRHLGNSYFGLQIVLMLIYIGLLLIPVLGIIGGAVLSAANAEVPGVILVVLSALLLIPIALGMAVVYTFVEDFVVPIMYHRDLRATDAWRVFRHEILAGRAGDLAVYFLFKLVIGLVAGMITVTIMIMSCCLLAFIPYIGSVVLLPLLVFLRAYPVYYLQQIGPEWQIFPDDVDLYDQGERLSV